MTRRADLVAAAVGLGAFAVAAVVGGLLYLDGHAVQASAAPLYAHWLPHIGPGTPLALLVAVLAWRYGPGLAGRLRWAALHTVAYLTAVAWTLSLALIDGWQRGIAGRLTTRPEYLHDVPGVTNIPATLRGFTARILDFQPDSWTTHVAGHPPAALLVFVGLDRLGLHGGGWAGLLCILTGALVAVTVPQTVRLLGNDATARACVPFLVLFPGAVWTGVSADGLFAGITSAGVMLLASKGRPLLPKGGARPEPLADRGWLPSTGSATSKPQTGYRWLPQLTSRAKLKPTAGRGALKPQIGRGWLPPVGGGAGLRLTASLPTPKPQTDHRWPAPRTAGARLEPPASRTRLKPPTGRAALKSLADRESLPPLADHATPKASTGRARVKQLTGRASLKQLASRGWLLSLGDRATPTPPAGRASLKPLGGRGWVLPLAGGVLLGLGCYLSYGLVLMGVLALAVVLIRRSWAVLFAGVVGAGAVAVGFTVLGFDWLTGYHLVQQRYYQGLAAQRPYLYWVWADLAILAVSAGPAAVAGLRRTVKQAQPGALRWLPLAALAAILAADVSGFSKAEVERIWLPFAVWLVAATGLLPAADRRKWLLGQAAVALLVNHLLLTTW
jgi:hypothetical protein